MIAVNVDDLAFITADAIVRPVDAELRAITPVIRRLEEAGGASLLGLLRVNAPLAVGAAVVTGGGALATPLMIHGVVATVSERVTRAGVRRAMLSALQRARDFDVARLAIAPFGLGAGNLDADEAARSMCEALCESMAEHARRGTPPPEITVVVESEYEAEAFRAALARSGLGSGLGSEFRA